MNIGFFGGGPQALAALERLAAEPGWRIVFVHPRWIGDHVHIAPGAALSGGVTVENGAHVGTGARIIELIRIGAGAMVAAGAVVVENVPPGAVVMGVPAREPIA